MSSFNKPAVVMFSPVHLILFIWFFTIHTATSHSGPAGSFPQDSIKSLTARNGGEEEALIDRRDPENFIKSITGSSFWQADLSDFIGTRSGTENSYPGHVSEANGAPSTSTSPAVAHATTTA